MRSYLQMKEDINAAIQLGIKIPLREPGAYGRMLELKYMLTELSASARIVDAKQYEPDIVYVDIDTEILKAIHAKCDAALR